MRRWPRADRWPRIGGRFRLVAGALSSGPDRAAASAAALGLDRSYVDFREMARAEAGRPDGVRAVSIVTPNHLHAVAAEAFLDAGQAGREKEMVVVGGAGMTDMIKRIMDKDPQLPVNVTYPPAMSSSAIETTALHFVSNAPMAGRYINGSQLITSENAKQYYFSDSPF